MIPKPGEIWRHKQRGTKYEIIATHARLQIKNSRFDESECIVYRSLHDLEVWVRLIVEFCDGRFERVATAAEAD